MTHLRKFIACGIVAAVALGLASVGSHAEAQKDEWTKLFNGRDLTGWKVFVDPRAKDADPKSIWTVKDGVIVCTGKPAGYIITEKDYDNYVLRVQWRWGPSVKEPKGPNSGVFVHVVGEDKIWPKGIEAQLASTRAGDFWLVGDFKLKVDAARQDPKVSRHYFRAKANENDEIEKPLGEWNQYEITCKGDTIKLVVNGHEVNSGTEAELSRGKILLQSEGTEIHFRNVELKPIK